MDKALDGSTKQELSSAIDLYDYDRDSLAEIFAEKFELPKFRTQQIFDWLYKKRIIDFSAMSNFSEDLQKKFTQAFQIKPAIVIDRQISKDGTRKYLLEVQPGIQVEAVMIKQPRRMTLCVSSQYGCGMGCKFCRTATMGLQGNLLAGDIIRQVVAVIDDAKNFNDMFTNIVFMGMGEPLHNLKNLTRAIKILKDPHGLQIAPRKITVSTVGLANNIRKFADADLGVNLAVSLNATTDEIRSEIMPVNKAFPIAELLSAVNDFPKTPRKKVTLEYVMLHGVNDNSDDIERLAKLTRKLPVKINLIPYNENAGLGFKSPPEKWVNHWQTRLNELGIAATIRWSKGQDINAACGQLKSAHDASLTNIN